MKLTHIVNTTTVKMLCQTVALPCTTYVCTCNYWQVKFLAICITDTIGFEHSQVINQQILTTTCSFCLPVGIPSSSAILPLITDTC